MTPRQSMRARIATLLLAALLLATLLLAVLLLAALLTACGGAPLAPSPDADAPDAAAIAALDTPGRTAALARVEAARKRRPDDPALLAAEGRLRLALGDAPGAAPLLRRAIERDADPALRATAWHATLASGDLAPWIPTARAAGDDAPDRPAPHAAHAAWIIARATEDLAAARAAARQALAAHPGDPALLAAAAAVELRAQAPGPALLLASRALQETPADEAPPRPARAVRAQALATLDPPSATAAFIEARADDLPATRRAEALFLLRHGRVTLAAEALADYTRDRPLDAEAATLARQIAEIQTRIDRARAASEAQSP